MSPHQLDDSTHQPTSTMAASMGPTLALPAHPSHFDEGVSKHKTSEKRRAQNRAAQKTYREKRKRRLEQLETLAASAGLIESSPDKDASPSKDSSSQVQINSQPSDISSSLDQSLFEDQFSFVSPTIKSKSPASLTNSSTSPAQDDPLLPEFSSSNTSLFQDQFSFFDPQPPTPLKSLSISLSDRTTLAPPTVELLEPSPDPFDFDQVVTDMSLEPVDEEIIRTLDQSSSDALVRQTAIKLADPQTNYLQLHTARVHWAFWHNVLHLGLNSGSCADDQISHFYRPDASFSINPDAVVQSVKATFSNIKPDLRPTKEQIMVRHASYLDILPFPDIRARMIEIMETNPSAFDEDEFWRDIEEEGGLVCWGSIQVRPGVAPLGCGAPWDGRSWEAKTWFLTKWSYIVGNDESSLSRSSQWWREMRGVGQGFSF